MPQFLKNIIVNGSNFLVKILLGLVLPPIIIRELSLSSYGFVQTAISIAAYTALLSTSLNQANNRFVAISVLNNGETNRNLTTIFTLYLSVVIIVLALLFIFVSNLDLFSS